MAAMRPVLAMLGRRCGFSGTSAASIHQALLSAAPRTPPLPYRRFSTGGWVPADKAENWWQRLRRYWYVIFIL
ncbi:hypothetical protein SETIT_5G138200v2 [Setaria italica]|uniref:Uncharacterized protein n=1 Tax=Setaria italica TaxID=4555 RepID=A0A368R4G4_SETIT|nr:hypothetical protein SETIT_5G138200v2 [Setaria italica]